MRSSVTRKILATMLIAALVLLSSFSTAHADTESWVLPWDELAHTSLSSAVIEDSNVTDVRSKVSVRAGEGLYNGYWHSMYIVFDSMLSYYLPLIAPAGGTVLESSPWHLDVQTGDGDLYELQIYGSNSTMYTFAVGDTILAGEDVGEIYLLDQEPTLGFEYLVSSEPSYLFGVSRWNFTDGTDLKDLSVNLYSESRPDLVADAITVNGLESPNYYGVNAAIVYEPNSWILFDTGITNSGTADPEQTFNVKWYINGYQVGYGSHSIVPAGTDMTEDNSYLWWAFDPGTYYIEFVVDCDNYILELDDTNNTSGVYIVVGY